MSCCASCADAEHDPGAKAAPCPEKSGQESATAPKIARSASPAGARASTRPPAAHRARGGPAAHRRPSAVPAVPTGRSVATVQVSEPGDAGERQADQLAARAAGIAANLGGDAGAGTHPVDPAAAGAAVAVANRATTPLPVPVRKELEGSLGVPLGHVRLDVGSAAGEAARSIGARAYTYGDAVVVDPAEYAPGTPAGKLLIAHEVVHTLQQGGSGRLLQRACLAPAACAAPASTLTNFVQDTNADPANVAKKTSRQTACAAGAGSPGCMTDGHGAQATALTAIMTDKYPDRLAAITGIYVDKDMPAQYGAYTNMCSSFTPPLAGARCTFVPDTMEAEAKLYRGGAAAIGGRTRSDWLTYAVGVLTHETGHAFFNAAAAIPAPSAAACKFADFKSNLSEMAAHLSEMHVYYRAALAKPEAGRWDAFNAKFDFWVNNGREDISGIVKDLRCKCECADADYYIKKTVEQVTSTQKWDTNEAFTIHTELSKPKWGLSWPVTPPVVNVNDLPTVAAQPLKFQ